MKQFYALIGIVVALASAPAQTGMPAKANPTVAQPRVLLLSNFKIVSGLVEQTGDKYRLIRGKDVQEIPISQVLYVGESDEAVRQYLASRGQSGSSTPKSTLSVPAQTNSLAARAYATRIQPIVMNQCSTCHTKPDHASEFKLVRISEGYANPQATEQNLATIAKFIDRTNPGQSPLLVKAMTAHGGQRQPAFRDRTHIAFQTLELWSYWVTSPEGSPCPTSVATAIRPTQATSSAPMVQPTPEARPMTSTDPYDPEEFNRTKK